MRTYKGSDFVTDEEYIDIAIEISKKAKYPYGAIVVKDNEIIGRSDDKTLMETSMYSHAELEVIKSASKNKIEVVKELHREKAVQILKERKKYNGRIFRVCKTNSS